MLEFMLYDFKHGLRSLIERDVSLDKELSNKELHDSLDHIAKSFFPLRDILRDIEFLPFPEDCSREELRDKLQRIVNDLQALFRGIGAIEILITDEVWVEINGAIRRADASYYMESTGDRNDRFIEVSARHLAACRHSRGRLMGTLLHEMSHAYVEKMYPKRGRSDWANGHNVWFFSIALSIEAQLELVLFEWEDLQTKYGSITLNLQTTVESHRVFRRRYNLHLEKARQRLLRQVFEGVKSFLLATREDARPKLRFYEDYDDDELIYGDVIYYPKVFG
jgi:hypothetical protein